MLAKDFSELRDLERQKKISIGIHKNKANNYFYGTSFLGKVLNWGTNGCVALLILMLFFNWKISLWLFVFTCFYLIIVQKIVSMIIRVRALNDSSLFVLLCKAAVITVRDNRTGRIYRYDDIGEMWF